MFDCCGCDPKMIHKHIAIDGKAIRIITNDQITYNYKSKPMSLAFFMKNKLVFFYNISQHQAIQAPFLVLFSSSNSKEKYVI